MKQTLLAFTLGLLVTSMTFQQAQAIPISGSIDMSGTAILNSMLLGQRDGSNFCHGGHRGWHSHGIIHRDRWICRYWVGFSWPSIIPVTPLWTFTSVAAPIHSI